MIGRHLTTAALLACFIPHPVAGQIVGPKPQEGRAQLTIPASVIEAAVPVRQSPPAGQARRDGLRDGVIKGAIWGAAIGSGGLLAAKLSNNMPHGCPHCPPVIAGTTAAGALAGLVIDAIVK